MTDHANELRRYARKIGHPAGDVPSVMLAAAEEIERLAAMLEEAQSDALEQARLNGMGSEREAALMAKLEAAEKERDALRAKIEAMEKTWLSPEGYHILMQEREDILFQAEKMKQRAPCKDISMWPTHHTQPTQPAPGVSEGWLRAIDEALIVTHLGVANAEDTYEQAREKLNNLIGWHVDVATDPAVNGGWKLAPMVSTYEMDYAGSSHCDGFLSTAQAVWDTMLAAAPGAKP